MNREQLIAGLEQAVQNEVRFVDMPEWGGKVFVRELMVADVDGGEVDESDDDKTTRLARGACKIICDEKGNRLLDPKNPDDVTYISRQGWKVLQRFINKSKAVNGHGPEGQEEAKND